jgi:DNA-binding beta-propeller fold protein YncE
MKRLVALALVAMSFGSSGADDTRSRVVDQGIAIDFSASTPKRPGDAVTFRFDVRDTASDTPIGGLRPAAWLARREANSAAPECTRKVATYLGGDLFDRADVDLTTYFVLSLDDGPSISVVDPLFGFGGSKLLTMLPLQSRGADWALDDAQHRLFVSMPAAGKVAVADTRTWRIVDNVPTGAGPRDVVVSGNHAWIADDDGLTAIETATLATTSVRFGRGGAVVASDDGDFVFATSGTDVVVIDAHAVRILARVAVDGTPTQLDYSAAARAVYAIDADAGRVFAIDARRPRVIATAAIRPGATQIRFAPGGRLALIPNPVADVVQVLDAATNRLVQTAAISAGPDRVSYTPLLAYVRRRGSEIVAMIPLEQLGTEGKPIGVADFPGGQHALGDGPASLADTIVGAPDGPAVLVANGADRMIYLYKEGMAAPAGGFSTYGRPPRAVLVVDGVFLLRPELAPLWTLSVYLRVSPEESLRRALVRDVALMGSADEVRRRYRDRYLPGQALYRAEADPEAFADVVLDNERVAA